MKGIDVSEHNGMIDWQKVKASDIDFCMIRAGYGKNNIDKQFVRNITECNRIGMPCGVYWFSYACSASDAKAEAKYCIAAVKPYKLSLPVAFDYEYDSKLYTEKQLLHQVGKTEISQMAMAFLNEVKASGYDAINYTNYDYYNRFFDDSVKQFPLWLAWWRTAEPTAPAHVIWQYASTGKVAGIAGNVDMNTSNLVIKKPEAPAEPKGDSITEQRVREIVREVLRDLVS